MDHIVSTVSIVVVRCSIRYELSTYMTKYNYSTGPRIVQVGWSGTVSCYHGAMKISFATDYSNLNLNNGYGYAGFQIIQALQRLGHTVPFRDAAAPVELWFCQPEYWEWSGNQYRIGYIPWESTELPYGWLENMQEADEIWTPSPWCKEVFESHDVRNVKVYQHGIDDLWTPYRRKGRNGTIRFLHVGEPAPRKHGQLTFETFRQVFGNRTDVHLTIKAHNFSTIRDYDMYGSIRTRMSNISNVTVLPNDVSQEEMKTIYWSHDVLIYPSAGEGFGFIPLQALATGMPVICTEAWAPYSEYLGPLALGSSLVDSPWPNMHPGKMYKPDREHLAALMKNVVTDFEMYSRWYYGNAERVTAAYDWTKRTEEAFADVVKKFENAPILN